MKYPLPFLSIMLGLQLLTLSPALSQSADLSPDEFEKAMAQSNIQVLDVRTPGEFKTGYIRHALHANWNNETEFTERMKGMDPAKPVYVYCLSGPRSSAATAWLNEHGFKAYNLTGGINAWKQAGKPLEQPVPVKQLSQAEYKALIPDDRTVLVDIGAPWCPPCKKMEPVVDSLSSASSAFTVVKIDGGQQTDICTALQVTVLPSFIIYKKGKETARAQGIVSAAALALLLE